MSRVYVKTGKHRAFVSISSDEQTTWMVILRIMRISLLGKCCTLRRTNNINDAACHHGRLRTIISFTRYNGSASSRTAGASPHVVCRHRASLASLAINFDIGALLPCSKRKHTRVYDGFSIPMMLWHPSPRSRWTNNNYVHGKLQNGRRASPNDIPQPARLVSS